MPLHFENYFMEHASSLLGEVLFYHLTLEALLTEIIRRDPSALSESKLKRLMFTKKADKCLEIGKLSPELHAAVLALNKVRNNPHASRGTTKHETHRGKGHKKKP
jgi:hypothetical protein